VLDAPTATAPEAPPAAAPEAPPATPPGIQPLPLAPLIFAGSLVIYGAEQLITRTADAYIANQNDKATYEAMKSVVEVENAHKKDARPSTEPKHQEGEARKARDRGGEKGDARRRPPRKPPDKWKGPWPPPPGTPWW